MKGVITVIFGLLISSNLVATVNPPLSIHLELAKDTLALAEPTVLRFQFVNESHNNQYFYYKDFHLHCIPSDVNLWLLTPDGKPLYFESNRSFNEEHGPDELIDWVLTPGDSFSYLALLRWLVFLLSEEAISLDSFQAGSYRLFATSWWYGNSDTLQFVFLPPDKEDSLALQHMNILASRYKKILPEEERVKSLEYLRNSNTSYSEVYSAGSLFLDCDFDNYGFYLYPWYQLDSFKSAKSRFNELYPNSPFEPLLIEDQIFRMGCFSSLKQEPIRQGKKHRNNYSDEELSIISEQIEGVDITAEKDSLFHELEKLIPDYIKVQLANGRMRWATLREARGQ